MAATPFSYQTTRQTTGYPAAPKKPARSIYAAPQAPVSSPYSSFLSTTGYQPAAPQQPQMQLQGSTPPPPPSAAHVAATTVTAPQSFDFHTDPILQQINAIGTQSRSGADAAALATKKQIATTYGDSDYARNVLKDSATADAAAQNQYSQYAMLAKQNTTNAGNLDESLNNHNLFFSGARIKQQGDLANQYGKAVADTAANEQQALGATENSRLAAYTAADQADSQAQQDAQARQLAQALLNQPAPSFDLSGLLSGGSGSAPTSIDGVPLTINGPGAVGGPTSIEQAHPYGTQTQNTSPLGNGGGSNPVPVANYVPNNLHGGVSGAPTFAQMIAAQPVDLLASLTNALTSSASYGSKSQRRKQAA